MQPARLGHSTWRKHRHSFSQETKDYLRAGRVPWQDKRHSTFGGGGGSAWASAGRGVVLAAFTRPVFLDPLLFGGMMIEDRQNCR